MTPENIWGIQQLNSCQKQYEPADDDITTVVHIHKLSPLLATFISHWSILRSFCFTIKSVKSQSYLHATSTRKKELSTKRKTLVLVRRVDNNSLVFQSDLCPSGHLSVCLSIDQSEQGERCHCVGEGRERKLGQRQDAYTSNDLIVLGCLRLPATTGFP